MRFFQEAELMRRIPVVAASIGCVFLLIGLVEIIVKLDARNGPPQVLRVAHAGGALTGNFGPNSIGGMSESFENGFRFIELDFALTSDHKIVCLRDWDKDIIDLFGFSINRKLLYKEFVALQNQYVDKHFRRCHQDTLLGWLEEHPSVSLITGFKSNEIQGLSIIKDSFPISQVIPQFYNWFDFNLMISLGFEKNILTLYRSNKKNLGILPMIERDDRLLAVTMTGRQARDGLAESLGRRGIPSYVHTVNDHAEFEALRSLGVTEIYTDSLPPPKFPFR